MAKAKAVAKERAAPEVRRGKPKFAKVGAKLHEQGEAEQQVEALRAQLNQERADHKASRARTQAPKSPGGP